MIKDLKEVLVDSSLGFGCLMLLFLISGVIGMFTWPYSLNSWLIFFGKEPNALWWHGLVLGVIPYFGYLSIPIAIITWILMMVLV